MKTVINIKGADLAWDSRGHHVRLFLKDKSDRSSAESFINSMEEGKQYAAQLGEVTKARSLDANAYAWVLLNKLSEILNLPSIEIYQNLIRDIGGVSEIIPVRDESAEHWCAIWMSRGEGWQCQKLDSSFLPGYSLYQCWYGSSVYDTKQMSRLIDLIVQECKEQGIQTMTPEEISKLKGLTDEK